MKTKHFVPAGTVTDGKQFGKVFEKRKLTTKTTFSGYG
jgi:hypothetical protein